MRFPLAIGTIAAVAIFFELSVLSLGSTVETLPTPQAKLNALVYGSDAQLINGRVLAPALKAIYSTLRSAASGDLAIFSDGSFAIENEAKEARTHPALTVSMPKMRAIAAASAHLQTLKLPEVTDRKIEDYDILVYPLLSGPHAGSFVVGFSHHKPVLARETRAGCIDSSGGLTGAFIVTIGSNSVTFRC